MSDEKAPERTTRVARRFGDDEVGAILEKAATMQARAGSTSDGVAGGLTLEEIRQIAQEAGIDPRFVDLATSDADAEVARKASGVAGGAYAWQYHATVPGEMADRDRDQILHAIRTVMGHKGELTDVYGRMEWSHDEGTGPVIVGFSSHDGQTEIDVSAVKSSEAGLIHGLGIPFGGVFGGAAIGGLLGLSGVAMLPVIAVAAGGSYAATRLGWKLRSKWWERRLELLVQRVSAIVQEHALPPATGSDEEK